MTSDPLELFRNSLLLFARILGFVGPVFNPVMFLVRMVFFAILRLFSKNSLKRLLGPGCHKQGKQCWIGSQAHNTERNGTYLQPGGAFPGTGEGPHLLDQRTLWGEGKTASICLFWGASSEFTVFGGPRITRGWERKTARKVSLSHPFLRPHMLVKTLICEECPHLLADKAREKRQIDPILPMYGEPWIFGIHHPILRIQQPIVPQVLQANKPSSKDHRSPPLSMQSKASPGEVEEHHHPKNRKEVKSIGERSS